MTTDIPGSPRWPDIGRASRKADLFTDDVFFTSGWRRFASLGIDVEVVRDLTVFIFKPDCFVSGRWTVALDFLVERGFSPVAFDVVDISPSMSRALWYFQWNTASQARLALSDAIFCSGPSVVSLFERPSAEVPSSVRLRRMKGATDPGDRPRGSLRDLVAGPNRMLTGTHSSDEPADVYREVEILQPRLAQSIVTERVPDLHDRLRGKLEEVGSTYPRVSFDLVPDDRGSSKPISDAIEVEEATLLSAPADQRWNNIFRYSARIVYDEPGIECIIADSGESSWPH